MVVLLMQMVDGAFASMMVLVTGLGIVLMGMLTFTFVLVLVGANSEVAVLVATGQLVLVLVLGLAIVPMDVVHFTMVVMCVDYLTRVHHWDYFAMRVVWVMCFGLLLVLLDHLWHENDDSVVSGSKELVVVTCGIDDLKQVH